MLLVAFLVFVCPRWFVFVVVGAVCGCVMCQAEMVDFGRSRSW